jgi:uncharacterized phage protein (TIGR01671 family)
VEYKSRGAAMREIKFRAWDKVIEKYIYSDDFPSMWQFFKELENRGIRHWEVEQFTGLHDKNDKEIFEGDIIDTNPNGRKQFLRKIIWNDKLACFQAPFSDGSGIQLFTKQQCLEYEVIGTIHDKE